MHCSIITYLIVVYLLGSPLIYLVYYSRLSPTMGIIYTDKFSIRNDDIISHKAHSEIGTFGMLSIENCFSIQLLT